MATQNQFEINGVVDTSRTVLDNLNTLCTAAGAWFTWDASEGNWSVIINTTGTSQFSFDDTNILGGVSVGGSGISELYNSVTIEFPHKDLRDHIDYIDLDIPSEDRFANELDNRLNIKLECINDPVQAQLIATRELKQSRVDKVIQFRTDYTANGLKAGDIIDVTNSALGYSAKLFRVTKLVEEDGDDGSIVLSVTALEYSADVYNTDGLIRTERNKKTGIIPKDQNDTIIQADQAALGFDLASLLGLAGPALNALLSAFKDNDIIQTRITGGNISIAELDSFMTTLGTPSGAGQDYPNASGYRDGNAVNSPLSLSYVAPADGFALVDWANPTADCLANVNSGATRFEAVTMPMYVLQVKNGTAGFLKPLTDTQNWIFFNQGDVITWYFVPYWYHEWSLGSNSRVVFYDPDYYGLVDDQTVAIPLNIVQFFTEKSNF